MVSKEALETQRFMGLRERVAYLWRQHDIWISKSALVLLYRRHGIEYAKARVMKKHLMIE